MATLKSGGHVPANCPTCRAITTFEPFHGGNCVTSQDMAVFKYKGQAYTRIISVLLRCAGCGDAGLAIIATRDTVNDGALLRFYPPELEHASLPTGLPQGVVREFREAEVCGSVLAWRAGSALFRSALEKTLAANGYSKGSLMDHIDAAAGDGVITAARQKRAHEDIRVLGNDILHDEWREVTEEEYRFARHYVQRILEDLYDSRAEVEAVLVAKGRVKVQAAP